MADHELQNIDDQLRNLVRAIDILQQDVKVLALFHGILSNPVLMHMITERMIQDYSSESTGRYTPTVEDLLAKARDIAASFRDRI